MFKVKFSVAWEKYDYGTRENYKSMMKYVLSIQKENMWLKKKMNDKEGVFFFSLS